MLVVENLSLGFGKRLLFEEVNLNLLPGNCYGIIGANGSGKSTFLKVLSGDVEPTKGTVSFPKDKRMAVLKQDQNQFNAHPVLETVIMGHSRLHALMKERETLYAKGDLSDKDNQRLAEVEVGFAEQNGWQAESEAGALLEGLGIPGNLHAELMSAIPAALKVRVLLAQAVFGNPDILLLDEPTNNLDFDSVQWLEEFLYDFENLVIVVSHDRHFLDKVCTHIADIDFAKITLFPGNFSFWKEASALILKQKQDYNHKMEEKIADLKSFIQRFSANASKSKQATARKKLLDKIELEDLRPSSRKFPYIIFKPDRDLGNEVLEVKGLASPLYAPVSFRVEAGEKVAFLSRNDLAVTTLFKTLAYEGQVPPAGVKWGQTVTRGYFPKDSGAYFDKDMDLVEWLRQYSKEQDATFVRGFLGRMLFTGEESQKSCRVLSGGEKVRCLLSKLMLSGANALILDEPTGHLDLEAISSLNDALIEFKGAVLFTSQDRQFVQTVANRVIEIGPDLFADKRMGFDQFLEQRKAKGR